MPTDRASEADPAPPTEPDGTVPTDTTLAGIDEPTGEVSAAGGLSDPAIRTTTLPGTLPATGAEPIALGLGALLVVAGLVVTALGTIATHGARRVGRGYRVRHR